MSTFIEAVSVAGAIAVAIVGTTMALTIFFQTFSWLTGFNTKTQLVAIKGVLNQGNPVTVRLTSGQVFTDVRYLGRVDDHSPKSGLPLEFQSLMIFEDEQMQRHLVRAKHIQMITVLPAEKV